MTVSAYDMALYAGALFILFLTPGTVWVAITARAIAGGAQAAWPLAFGVAVGDVLWPLLAILGVGWIVSVYAGFLTALRILAVVMFAVMGLLLIRNAGKAIAADSRLTRPGALAGFLSGVAVILSNPKAILFYMGVLPGFFDLGALTPVDIVLICTASFMVPLLGNLALALFLGRARALLASPAALRRTNVTAGWLLIAVAAAIAAS